MIFETESKARLTTGLSYIGSVNSSAKIQKNGKKGVLTYIIYLAPAWLSGRNTCPMHTESCAEACLAFSGRARIFNKITTARVKKTNLFFDERDFYSRWVFTEIARYKKLAVKKGMEFSVRINGTSDINPEIIKVDGVNVFQAFSDVQFYDYTKVFSRIELKQKYSNYHLTYSYSGENWLNCEIALLQGVNVSVVFEKVPTNFRGYKVVSGDETDIRYWDEPNVLVGLKLKKTGRNQKDNKFIVKENDLGCVYENLKELILA